MHPFIVISEKYNFKIPTYILSFFIGVVILIILARRYAIKEKFSKYDVLYAVIYGIIGIFLGAKLFYFLSKVPKIVTHFSSFIESLKNDTMNTLASIFGGLVFYGGLIGAILGVYIYCRQYKISFMELSRILVPYFPLAHAFGRVGCFFAGCCFGMEYYGPLSVQFPYNELVPELSSVPRLPVQLIEAFINLIIFAILIYLRNKKRKNAMFIAGAYCLMYAVVRYTLEFFRGDSDRGDYGFITTSQFISIFIIAIAVFLFRKSKKYELSLNGNGVRTENE